MSYVHVLHNNTLTCIWTLVKEATDFGYTFTADEQRSADVIDACDSRAQLSLPLVEAIEHLWRSSAIQQAYARRSEYWILDSADSFILNARRFIAPDYRPTEEDIVLARKRTTGVVETELKYGNVKWTVVDVGGQRSERRKWLNCFDNAKGLLFVVNLAGFCSPLFEDRTVRTPAACCFDSATNVFGVAS